MIDVRDVLIHPEKFDGNVVTVKGRLYSGGEKTSFIVPLYGDVFWSNPIGHLILRQ
ncbi:hypothetical protein Q4519_21705 [Motilimonas sp. 1_MG-2023]|uniref:hypothetical protein n=1 Tax=Motilimonas sp. 1_MG-2023 TaxID=3062672 RepID=UPI0026E31989|nr:hypothetical protein [Motilimonas sp. 1_MG-2023]MDO6528268.1 hypothetical protein [Motilimonas sp. 1_MG-2023]